MTRADLPAISDILDKSGLFPSDMLADMAAPFLEGNAPHFWLSATSDSDVIGFAYTEPERMTDGTYNLLAIAVDPSRQSAGVGQTLVIAMENAVSKQGGRVLLVETSSLPDYARTREFYARLGYTHEATIRDYYAAGEDKVVFWKSL